MMRSRAPPKPQPSSGFWSRPLFAEPTDSLLCDQAMKLLRSHAQMAETGKPPADFGLLEKVGEQDLVNALEILKGQMEKTDDILATLAYVSVSSPSLKIRMLAKEIISEKY